MPAAQFTHRLVPTLVLILAVVMLAAAPAARPAGAAGAADTGGAACFFRRQWRGTWKTAPDSRAIYINVSGRTYRLDLQAPYPLLGSAWARLTDRDASNTICSPDDFRLVVSDRIGVHQQVIVTRMTLLTAAQAAALPPALRP
ncbi:MAG TPA: hypothetical protein VMB48_08675 [Steroidobacteraceae bacterium]|nr:hypothetical protein [Steroidobacteraceae bacterium]